jgi:TonB family protein
MNRLQKKCFIFSTSLHGLLLFLLVFGAALMPSPKPLPSQNIRLISQGEITDALTRGGDPTAQAAPPPPQPTAAVLAPPVPPSPQNVEIPKPPVPVAHDPPPVPKPVTPVKPIVKPVAVVPKPEPPKATKPPKPALTPEEIAALNKPTVRTPKDAAQAAKAAEDAANARAEAARKQRIAKAFGQSVANLSKGPSPSVDIKPFNEHGDGGPMAANYRDVVGSKYKGAWTPPPSLTDEHATTTASITIDRDGKVKSARITKGSGNAGMDKSVQTTLDNVTFIAPFPPESNDQERTYDIQFNLKAKLSAG